MTLVASVVIVESFLIQNAQFLAVPSSVLGWVSILFGAVAVILMVPSLSYYMKIDFPKIDHPWWRSVLRRPEKFQLALLLWNTVLGLLAMMTVLKILL
jgi:hypothetical protein